MTMTVAQSILTIAAVVLATMLTRFLPFLIFPEGRTPPAAITYLSTVLPYAVIGLLVVYCLKDAVFPGGPGRPGRLAIVFTAALQKWKKNPLLSSAGGPIAYMIRVQIFSR